MPLSGKAVAELQNALISAFSADELTRLVRIHLDENLDAIAGDDNLNQTVFELITWADRYGRLDELIRGAANVNPGNQELRTWIETHSAQINAGDLPQPEQPDAATTTADLNRKLKVFLCHASEDKEIVRELYHQLKADGLDPWLDEVDILPGQEWQREIPRAVRSADAVLVCLSNSSIDKEGYIKQETQFALDVVNKQPNAQIYLIPLRLEDCCVPNNLRRWQWVDLFTEGGYTRLLESLRYRASRLGLQNAVGASDGSSFVTTTKPKRKIPWVALGGIIAAIAVVIIASFFSRGLNVLNSFRPMNNATSTVVAVASNPSPTPSAATDGPTNTPKPSDTPTELPEPADTPTKTPKPRNTPTETVEPTSTSTRTPEPTNIPTKTPRPTNTPTKTRTPIPPTSTPDTAATEEAIEMIVAANVAATQAARPTNTAMPTATPRPTATYTPTPRPQLSVTGEFVNLRSGPGTNYDIVGTAQQSEQFDVLGKSPNGEWWQIQLNSQEVWIFSQLTQTENVGAVQVTQNIPPTPTPAPTPIPPTATFIPPTSVVRTSGPSGVISLSFINPPEDDNEIPWFLDTCSGIIDYHRFEWTTNVILQPNQSFELVIWLPNEDPMRQSLSVTGPTSNRIVQMDVSDLHDVMEDRYGIDFHRTDTKFNIGVLFVQNSPYNRLQLLGSRQGIVFGGPRLWDYSKC